jgi:DNA-binding transcriptional MerR regulator
MTMTAASGLPQPNLEPEGSAAGTGAPAEPAQDVPVAQEAVPAPVTPPPAAPRPARQKSLTIGAVCKALKQEFPDISISKIRYLEDQKLLTPRRTQGGYRVYTQNDVQRLRTILRLQRDEFLPLRVIRQELASGRAEREMAAGPASRPDVGALRRPAVAVRGPGARYSLEDVVEETGAEARLIHELEEFGVIRSEQRGGVRYYDETDREIVRAVTELARYGVAGRNLRVFRTSADRESALLQQILAPALRSRNPERRREAVETLENLAAVATYLKHLLLIRDLRRISG